MSTEQEQIHAAIAALSAQRAVLGNTVVDLAVAPLLARLAAVDAPAADPAEQTLRQVTILFLDVVGSTAFAEAHGDLRAQEYLGAIFATLAEPVRRNGGSVDDYIGDLAMVTWPMRRGLKDGRCVACLFAVIDRIEAEAEAWTARFGVVPRLRAALHGGSVVTAEVGVDRHKIAYFGDAVNVTSRIEALCRPLAVGNLISQDLLDRLGRLPEGVRARSLGAHALHGRGATFSVATLERAPETVPQAGAEAWVEPPQPPHRVVAAG